MHASSSQSSPEANLAWQLQLQRSYNQYLVRLHMMACCLEAWRLECSVCTQMLQSLAAELAVLSLMVVVLIHLQCVAGWLIDWLIGQLNVWLLD